MADTKTDTVKSLANCKPSEFLKQTNKIKKYVEKWFKVTGIPDIRKHLPDIPEGVTKEERDKLIKEQSAKNLSAMFDAALDEHTEETLGILALCCFTPVEEADNVDMDYYITALADMIESEAVQRFFISLVRWGLRLGK